MPVQHVWICGGRAAGNAALQMGGQAEVIGGSHVVAPDLPLPTARQLGKACS